MARSYLGSYLEPPEYAPPALRRLPIDLLRSHLYPRQPALVARAVASYHADEPLPVYLPQRMGFTRYKTPPWQSAWGQNVAGYRTAMRQGPAQVRHLYAAGTGRMPTISRVGAARALEASRLPMPYDNAADLDREPYARNALPVDRMLLTTDDLAALERAHNDQQFAARYEAEQRVSSAMRAINETQSALFHALGEDADVGYR